MVPRFRFYGRIAKEPNAHEGTILKTIQQNGDGLQRISGERIWMELKQILEGNFAGHLLQMILHCRLGPYIGRYITQLQFCRIYDVVWQVFRKSRTWTN